MAGHGIAHLRRRIDFARHLRPGQVARRLALKVTRPAMVQGMRLLPGAGELGPDLPASIFPPRCGRIEVHADSYAFTFLNQRRELHRPPDWQLGRLGPQQQLWKMNLHYMEYLEEVDDEAFVALVGDWIPKNLPWQPQSRQAAWNTYALSIRCVVWLQQVARRREHLPAAFVAAISGSLAQQLRFLAANIETDVLGNHLIKNIKALLWAAACFTGPQAAGWGRLGALHLEQQLEEQVLPDGCHYERSPSYHCQVFADLLECYRVLGSHPLRVKLTEALARMAQATADLTHPDGSPALFNDSGLAMAYEPVTCLEVYRHLLGHEVRPRRHIAMPEAGYYGLRRDDGFVLADCGQVAPDFLVAHGHCDVLSFEWSVGGCRLVVDPGVYEYNAGWWRTYARSTAAHNTVTVGDGEQCEFFGAFRCGRRARVQCHHYALVGDGFVLEGSHDGFERLPGLPRHVRRFEVRPERVVITDRIENGRGQPVRARLLLHPDWQIELDGRQAVFRRGALLARLTASASLRLEPAWWCPDMGVRIETRRLVVEYGGAPCEGRLMLERTR